jgi:hypothetical protein
VPECTPRCSSRHASRFTITGVKQAGDHRCPPGDGPSLPFWARATIDVREWLICTTAALTIVFASEVRRLILGATEAEAATGTAGGCDVTVDPCRPAGVTANPIYGGS